MRPLLPLAVFLLTGLSACTPALDGRLNAASVTWPYMSGCGPVLAALENVAVRTRPGFFRGDSDFSALDVVRREKNRLTFISRDSKTYLLGQPAAETIETVALCTEANGTTFLTLSSKGQPRPYLEQLHRLLHDGVRLP